METLKSIFALGQQTLAFCERHRVTDRRKIYLHAGIHPWAVYFDAMPIAFFSNEGCALQHARGIQHDLGKTLRSQHTVTVAGR